MNYKKHYDKLIERAVNRNLDQYTEIHHIIPRCMGGSDNIDNLVKLLPEEHYVAHLLLAKTYPNISGLWFACAMMCMPNSDNRKGNKYYSWVRNRVSKKMSDAVKDKWSRKRGYADYVSQSIDIWKRYTKDFKTSVQIRNETGISLGSIRSSLRFYAANNDCYDILIQTDKKHKSDSFKKIRANFTPEQEARRISAVKKMDYGKRTIKIGSRHGKKNPVYGKRWKKDRSECPHCKMMTATNNRWHFKNCKERII